MEKTMRIINSIEQLIGHTPLLSLERIKSELGLNANILAKLEMFNPGGSAKDRIAKKMLDMAKTYHRIPDLQPTGKSKF